MPLEEGAVGNERRDEHSALQREVTGDLKRTGAEATVSVLLVEGDEQVDIRLLVGVAARTGAEEEDVETGAVAVRGESPSKVLSDRQVARSGSASDRHGGFRIPHFAPRANRTRGSHGSGGLQARGVCCEVIVFLKTKRRCASLRSLIEKKPISHACLRLAHLLIDGRIANIVATPKLR